MLPWRKSQPEPPLQRATKLEPGQTIGVVAGNGELPLRFLRNAKQAGVNVAAICHQDETVEEVAKEAQAVEWVKVGQLGAMIKFFHQQKVSAIAMIGGISRVRTFRDIKLDSRAAMLIARIRTMKDDALMRGIAEEFEKEGFLVVESTLFLADSLVPEGLIGKHKLSSDEKRDVEVGRAALLAMSDQHIGQLVVVKDGVVVAVEAVEGSDAAIRRGGELGGPGAVIVKCAKLNQDMRFDVPIVGPRTLETIKSVSARVLAVEAGRCLMLDSEQMIETANSEKISIFGCPPLAN